MNILQEIEKMIAKKSEPCVINCLSSTKNYSQTMQAYDLIKTKIQVTS